MKLIITKALQICLLYILYVIGEFLSSSLNLSIPGSILGLFLLFLLLHLKVIKLHWVDIGATWLLSELILFFVPSAVGIVEYKQIMESIQGVKIVLVIILSTLVVMAFTGLSAEFLSKFRKD
ncbi:CidA/LrgA family holin-like protein (plasmid) [Bacillus mycoides]|nr:CidA/LrgA family holin-like protein [Bacillus mycoides]